MPTCSASRQRTNCRTRAAAQACNKNNSHTRIPWAVRARPQCTALVRRPSDRASGRGYVSPGTRRCASLDACAWRHVASQTPTRHNEQTSRSHQHQQPPPPPPPSSMTRNASRHRAMRFAHAARTLGLRSRDGSIPRFFKSIFLCFSIFFDDGRCFFRASSKLASILQFFVVVLQKTKNEKRMSCRCSILKMAIVVIVVATVSLVIENLVFGRRSELGALAQGVFVLRFFFFVLFCCCSQSSSFYFES